MCAAANSRYLITSSAVASSDFGMVRPSSLAVLRLMTNSNFVDCSTGRKAVSPQGFRLELVVFVQGGAIRPISRIFFLLVGSGATTMISASRGRRPSIN
jgi:hypothetical protein